MVLRQCPWEQLWTHICSESGCSCLQRLNASVSLLVPRSCSHAPCLLADGSPEPLRGEASTDYCSWLLCNAGQMSEGWAELTKDNVTPRSRLHNQVEFYLINEIALYPGSCCSHGLCSPYCQSRRGAHQAPSATHPVDHMWQWSYSSWQAYTEVLLRGKCFTSYPAKALIREIVCLGFCCTVSLSLPDDVSTCSYVPRRKWQERSVQSWEGRCVSPLAKWLLVSI